MLFQNILVAYDGSKASNKALDQAIDLAKLTPGAKLDVVHVFDFPRVFIGEAIAAIPASVNQEIYDLAEQTLDEVRTRLSEAAVTANVVMIQGDAAEVILAYAKQHESDLIVIGSRGLGGIREFVLGSVSHNVVQNAKIPVLINK